MSARLASVRPPRAAGAPVPAVSVVAIGASTGGTEVLRAIFERLPARAPGIVVVQHMREGFTGQFAARLDRLCQVRIQEASDGDPVVPGRVLVAPAGDRHLEVSRTPVGPVVRLVARPPVRHHRPSVDVLFESCAWQLGASAIGVILTGMGDDGARGLRAMRDRGARTIAQDEASCVVFGMPRVAMEMGAVDLVLSPPRIAEVLAEMAAGAAPAAAFR